LAEFLKLLADLEKACGFLVAEQLKEGAFYVFWKLPL